MYNYTGPSLAAGGRLVKKGQSPKATPKAAEKRADKASDRPLREVPDPERWTLTAEEMARNLAPGWDEGGWHGGGMCRIRNMKQKVRPSKGNTRTGRRAHPNLLHLTK